jgi:hypothetical protein
MAVTARHVGVTVTARDPSRHVTPPYKGCDECDGVTVAPGRGPEWVGGFRERSATGAEPARASALIAAKLQEKADGLRR